MWRAPILALPFALLAVVTSTASATTAPSLIVPVKVSLTTHAVTLSQKRVNRGYYVEFGVRNRTATRRLFSVAGRTVVVPPRKLRLLAIQFSVRGRYRYVSRGPGTAVHGTFRVS
jgi:hypothetical protein